MPGDDILIKIGARDNASKVLKKVGQSASNLAKTTSRIRSSIRGAVFSFQGLAAAATGAGALKVVGDELERIDNIAKTSRKLGLPTNELIAFRLAAEEMSGMMDGQVDMALQRMTRRISEAASGSGEAVKALQELNLNAGQLNLDGPAEAFKQIADAMTEVENPADRLRLAFKLFDSEGASLVTTLEGGREGLDRMKLRAEELGLTFKDDVAANIEKTNDALTEMKKAGTGLVSQLTQSMAPALLKFAEGMQVVLDKVNQIMEFTEKNAPKVGEEIGRTIGGAAPPSQRRRRFGGEVMQPPIGEEEKGFFQRLFGTPSRDVALNRDLRSRGMFIQQDEPGLASRLFNTPARDSPTRFGKPIAAQSEKSEKELEKLNTKTDRMVKALERPSDTLTVKLAR